MIDSIICSTYGFLLEILEISCGSTVKNWKVGKRSVSVLIVLFSCINLATRSSLASLTDGLEDLITSIASPQSIHTVSNLGRVSYRYFDPFESVFPNWLHSKYARLIVCKVLGKSGVPGCLLPAFGYFKVSFV